MTPARTTPRGVFLFTAKLFDILSLTSGSRVGPYTVIEPLGSGGMGDVFRARDTRLERDVALKILPASALTDPASRARFDREARALASLNHSAVAQIFGIESHGDAPVIVMEVVEGPTLAERLAKGPLHLTDAVAVATQICEGLEAAHERGIVHRDLKPANVKVRPDGAVKLLDFGIARALDAGTPNTDESTVTGGSTETGIVIGTPAYMSPEQAKGQPVDKRTDIWAFGCVLFEMLTGARPFGGDSTAEILANVVHQEPDWSKLPAGTPARVIELIRRCLQKNVKDRLRDIGDARYELARALQPREADSGAVAGTRPLRSAAWFAAGAAALAIMLLAVAALRRDDAAPVPAYRAAVTLPAGMTLSLAYGSSVVISPDGQTIAFTGRSKDVTMLYARRLDEFESRPLAGTEGAQHPFFSPDGKWIGFLAGDKLKRVAVEGGAPIPILDAANPRGQAWTGDDRIVYTPTNTAGLSQVGLTGGTTASLTTLGADERSHRWPTVLPGGSILFSIWNDLGWEPARIALRAADGSHRTILQGGGYPRYVGDRSGGILLFARAEGLMAVRFDPASGSVQGNPVPVLDGVLTNVSGGAHFDVSSNGTLAFVPGGLLEAERRLVWLTMDGKPEPALQLQGMTTNWRLSPDGRRVIRNNTMGQSRDNWIEDLSAGTSTKLPNPNKDFVGNPVWSHDGSWVAFAIDRPVSNIFRQPSDGRAVVERLTDSPNRQLPRDISRDGRHLAYTEFDTVTGADVWVMALPAAPPGAAPVNPRSLSLTPLVQTSSNELNPVFSPDGTWIAYQSNATGRFEIYVRSFPSGDRTLRVSADGGVSPAWSADGREIFFRDASSRLRAAALSAALSGSVPKARDLFDVRDYESSFAVAPDGTRLLMMPLADAERAATTINIIFNFLDELRRRIQ